MCYYIHIHTTSDACPCVGISYLYILYFYRIGFSPYQCSDCLYMNNMRGFSAIESGIATLPGALINGMMSPITGRTFDRYGAKWLAVIGFIILTVSTLFFANLSISTSMLTITILYAIRMFGISM